MRFKLWIYWRNIRRIFFKIYDSKILNFIRGTLIYNICKMLVLIFVILGILFKVAPHTAYINYCSNQIDFIDAKTNLAMIELETNRFSITNLDEQEIHIMGAEIFCGEQSYGSEYSILINPYIKSEGSVFVCKGNRDNLNLKVQTKTYTNNAYAYFYCLGNQTFVESGEGIQTIINDAIYMYFGNLDAYLIKDEEPPIQIIDCVIVPSGNNMCFIMDIASKATFNILQYDNDYVYSKADISLFGINNTRIQSTGELEFSYTPDIQKYNTNNQLLYLESSDGNGKINFLLNHKDTNTLVLFGQVKQAYLSSLNLFPTFKGWFQSNIYLIPLTLISTIFGGITLMNRKKQ